MPAQLKTLGVADSKINTSFVANSVKAREAFVADFAKERGDLKGAIAELGVYRGDFARQMNAHFPNKTFYLLDTFEGFAREDVNDSETMGSAVGAKHFANTSVDLVLSKMPHPENCKVVAGFFPDTAAQITEQDFLLVNLDCDLYAPILAGLEFFYPRMVTGGVILVHEYFSTGYLGVQKAVNEFFEKNRLPFWHKMPIGDQLSVAILKIPR